MKRAILLLLLLLAAVSHASPGAEVVVITHPSRDDAISPQELAQIYLRKRRYWNDGSEIVPLNHPSGAQIREDFSRALFGVPSADFSSYWNKQYFQGILPPATLPSDAAVVRYVSLDPDAIGYVRPDAVDESVRVASRFRGKGG